MSSDVVSEVFSGGSSWLEDEVEVASESSDSFASVSVSKSPGDVELVSSLDSSLLVGASVELDSSHSAYRVDTGMLVTPIDSLEVSIVRVMYLDKARLLKPQGLAKLNAFDAYLSSSVLVLML